ncbi:MAG: CsgG/HfaB family protein [Myxococcota bacterium]
MRALLLCWMATLLWVSTPSLAARTLAVLPLEKGAGDASYDGLGTALAGMLVSDLAHVEGLQLVERQRLSDVLDELELSKTRFIDPKSAQTLGKGLGSDLILTGSYTVLNGRFIMDARLINVETAAIIRGTQSAGDAADFVAVEKDIVEQLLVALKMELSLSQRRKLLMQTPTEDLEALSQFGIGVEATDAGDPAAAVKAYEAALREDPEFSEAALALADLKRQVSAAATTEGERYRDTRAKARAALLAKIPSEMLRKPGFKDTAESDMDLMIRLRLLLREKQDCAVYDELRHYLERRKGQWTWWVNEVPGEDHFHRYALARIRLGRRIETWAEGDELTLKEVDTHDVMHVTSFILLSPSQLLFAGGLHAPPFRQSLASAVTACFDPSDQGAVWADLTQRVRALKLGGTPLRVSKKDGPTAETIDDGLSLHAAFIRASAQGVDRKVQQRVQALLVRHPSGSPAHSTVVNAVEDVIEAGEAHDRRLAKRMGMTDDALIGATRAIQQADPSALRLQNPICAQIVKQWQRGATLGLQRLDESPARDRDRHVDNLGGTVAAVVMARCFTASAQPALTVSEAFAMTRAAAEQPHPAADVKRCTKVWSELRELTTAAAETETAKGSPVAQGSRVSRLMRQVHQARSQLCLINP